MNKNSLTYSTKEINRNFRIKVAGVDANGNKINKLVGVSGAIALITGPYLAVGVAGKKKIEGNTFGESASVSYDTFGENAYRRFDAGWNIGIGVEISRFIVSLDTQLGFCKLYDSDNAPRNVNIGLLVGYKF